MSDTIRLKGPHDIVAAVPYLVGFHPDDSLVCVVVDNSRVAFVARLDLPTTANDHRWRQAAYDTAVVVAQYGSAAIMVGYGVLDRVKPAAATLTAALLAADVHVLAILRVHHGRYWRWVGGNEGCPPDGTVYEPAASPVPAEAAYRGVAPLPSRAALQQLIEPITGRDRDTMRAASGAALRRLHAQLTDDASDGDRPPSPVPDHVVRGGIAAVRQAFATAAQGQTLSDDDAAWLTAVLLIPEVRDHAWIACDGGEAQRRLWIDVTRRAIAATAAAPACLLAVTAYLVGDGALARVAVDRAMQVDPEYVLARLLDCALQAGVPPHLWRQASSGTPTT
jgi:hypothetical protein